MPLKILLDTHALVWWWTDNPRLPALARAAIAAPGNTIYASAASAWEIATKHRIGKWPEVGQIADQFDSLLRRSRFVALPITAGHARLAGALEGTHRDPFDRVLIAQARQENLTIISGDAVFPGYGTGVIWDAERGDTAAG